MDFQRRDRKQSGFFKNVLVCVLNINQIWNDMRNDNEIPIFGWTIPLISACNGLSEHSHLCMCTFPECASTLISALQVHLLNDSLLLNKPYKCSQNSQLFFFLYFSTTQYHFAACCINHWNESTTDSLQVQNVQRRDNTDQKIVCYHGKYFSAVFVLLHVIIRVLHWN